MRSSGRAIDNVREEWASDEIRFQPVRPHRRNYTGSSVALFLLLVIDARTVVCSGVGRTTIAYSPLDEQDQDIAKPV